jgi:putative flippase GtrA
VIKLLRFATVGVVNTLIGYAVIFACMHLLKMEPVISNVVGYTTGLVTSFVLNRRYTFRSRAAVWPEALRFGIFFGAAWLLNLGTLIGLTRFTNVGPNIAQVAAGITYFGAFFLLSKLFVFRPDNDPA